jgi:hypothetical protein
VNVQRSLASDFGEAAAITAPQKVEATRAAIAAWLLHGGVQLTAGENAGAVAGWLSPSGRIDYVYPEITGYYLQWLAWHALRHGDVADLDSRADAAQRWLSKWIQRSDPPQTRVYLAAQHDDWRNRALFFFDVAMVVRGLAWCAHAGLLSPDPLLVERLCVMLQRLVATDGMFDACVLHPGATAGEGLPLRWSTRRGAFLAKAADGVLFAAQWLPHVPTALVQAAASTFDASVQYAITAPHKEAHPLLYALEGVLNRAGRTIRETGLSRLAPQFDALIERVDSAGHLAETAGAPGAARLDIVAQAIRIDAVLRPAPERNGTHTLTAPAAMIELLVRNAGNAGALPFAPDQRPVQFNVWTAMFAEQALALAQDRCIDRRIAWAYPCLI